MNEEMPALRERRNRLAAQMAATMGDLQLGSVQVSDRVRGMAKGLDDPSFEVRDRTTSQLMDPAIDDREILALLDRGTLSDEAHERLLRVAVRRVQEKPRGAIGVRMANAPPDRSGVVVQATIPGLPADKVLQPGDVLTIGETPLAVMQGRYHHPETVEPSFLARQLCRVFHPTSSLASACGLQSLIDVAGPARVLMAWLVGTALKLVGLRGWFYRLAGEQARLIDDITGTTPPYDQTIVLGPDQPAAFCNAMARELGVAVAVVDVNDLGRVKVLAASQGCDEELLQRALRPNPAGNANERTPLVLVRPA